MVLRFLRFGSFIIIAKETWKAIVFTFDNNNNVHNILPFIVNNLEGTLRIFGHSNTTSSKDAVGS